MTEIDRKKRAMLISGGLLVGGATLSKIVSDEIVPVPNTLNHRLNLGFTFDADEAKHQKLEPDKAFTQLTNMGFSWVRLCWRLSNPQDYNFKNWYSQMDKAKANGLEVVQVVGTRQPYYPEEYLPPGLSRSDSEFSQKYAARIRQSLELMKNSGLIDQVDYWQIGNESLTDFWFSFGPKKEPKSLLEQTQDIIADYSDKPTLMTDFLNPFGPQKSWGEIHATADIPGIDVYPQFGPIKMPIAMVCAVLDTYTRHSIIQPWAPESQILTWIKNIFGLQQHFTDRDRDNLFYSLAQRVSNLGLWESEKWLLPKNSSTLTAVEGYLAQAKTWNNHYAQLS